MRHSITFIQHQRTFSPQAFSVCCCAWHVQSTGKAVTINASPDTPLLWALRDDLKMNGTKLAEGVAMQITGFAKDKVNVHTTFLGGGFGRRIDVDFIVQAIQISKAVGKPVKLIWTREYDMTHDFYRPVSLNTLSAGLDTNGNPVAMKFRLTSPSVTSRLFPPVVKDGIDPFMAEASVLPYDIPNTRVEMAIHDAGVRVGYWRSVSHALNCFANESFIDELASAAGKDPVAYRLAMLNGNAAERFRNVLNIATKAGWGKAPKGRFHGVALMEGYDTYVAQVAEIAFDKSNNGAFRVHKVTCALRHDGESGHRKSAGGVKRGLRYVGGAAFQNHLQGWQGRAKQLPRLPGVTHEPDAGRRCASGGLHRETRWRRRTGCRHVRAKCG